MKKRLLLLIFFFPFFLSAQSLKFGLKAAAPLRTNLQTLQTLTYHYADDRNSTYLMRPDNGLTKRFLVFPRIFAQYTLQDNFLLGYEASFSTFLKKYTIRATTDFKNNLLLDTHYDYSFLANTLYGGYKFLRTRELRPKIYSGLTHLRLLGLTEVSNRSSDFLLKNIDPYGKIIHQQINALNKSIFVHTLGFGLAYYIVTVDITYDYSITPLEKKTTLPLYTRYQMLTLTAGINLLGVLPNVGRVKKGSTE